jgi:hypothetical protein
MRVSITRGVARTVLVCGYAACALLLHSACGTSPDPRPNANPALPAEQDQHAAAVRQLSQDRDRLFRDTRDRPDSGYIWGPEGSFAEILFPVGRGDRLWYFSWREGAGKPKADLMQMTCWQRHGSGVQRVWQIRFLRGRGRRAPKGTLLLMAHGVDTRYGASQNPRGALGYRPNPKEPSWKMAKSDLETSQPLIVYHLGQHLMGEQEDKVIVLDSKLRRLDELDVPNMSNLEIAPGEVKLMKSLHMFLPVKGKR